MTFRSYFGKLMSWIPIEIDPHEGEPSYFDFVTYFGLVSLSMGTIANLNPPAKDNSAHDEQSRAGD